MPDQPVDLPDADGLDGILAVIHTEPGLKVDGVLADLVSDQKDQLLLRQQGPQVQDLEIGAEGPPVRVMEIDVVLPAHPLAFPHIVPEVLQLILGVHIRRQYGLVQVLEEVSADHRVPEVQRLPEGLRLYGKGDVALVVVGVKAEGQLLKSGKVLLEAVGIFAQQAAVLLVSALQEFDVGLVKSLGHQLQQSFPLEAPAVEGAEGVIGHLVVPAVFKQVKGGLQLCLRLAVPGVGQSQGIGGNGVALFPQLRHAAGDSQG